MNNTLKTRLIKRINELISIELGLAKDLREISKYNVSNYSLLLTGAESLILKLVGENSPHYKNLQQSMMSQKADDCKLAEVNGILRALRDELNQGLLGEVENLVRGEVFTDFLEMAHHLLETGYKDPAAVLVGTVLENSLKKLAEENDIQFKDNASIGALNKALAKAKVYTRLKQQQVQAWAAIRNSAAHGNTDEYNADDVKYMLEGVQSFLTEHLG